MIAQVTGRVLGRGGEGVVLEVGGVGLEVVATRGAEAAARPGTTVTLQTHLHVREDALQLFGFADVGERRLFRLLLGVSGVGPRLALAVGQARGAALVACGTLGVPVAEYAVSVIKTAVCGFGRAEKAQVGRMVRAILALDGPPASEHAADALAAAICHTHHARRAARLPVPR